MTPAQMMNHQPKEEQFVDVVVVEEQAVVEEQVVVEEQAVAEEQVVVEEQAVAKELGGVVMVEGKGTKCMHE